jgi:hypothetical protein
VFTGPQKLAFARRLGNNWQDLADYFDLPVDQRHSFVPGREPQGVWEWLEAHQRLPELLDALRYIDRTDIVVAVLAPPAMPASTPGVTWQGLPFPGLRHFTPDDAAIFFGRNQESTELLTRVQRERCRGGRLRVWQIVPGGGGRAAAPARDSRWSALALGPVDAQ